MKEIVIINNGSTSYHIVHSTLSTEAERYACKELQKYLYYATNTLIPVFSDKCQKRSKEIIIGSARCNNKNELLAGKSSEAFLIKEENGELYLTGNSPRAILYAVYKFLEEFIGFRCFSSSCEKYSNLDTLKVKTNYTLIQDFTFEYREAYWNDAFDGDFACKNMLNSNLADLSNKHGNKVKWFNFHHSFGDLISPNEYFDTHPEYFSLIDGKRTKEHTELCLSNNDVFELVLKKVKKWINDNPGCKIFSVAQDEWMGHFTKMACECDNCRKIDEENNSQSGSIITFVNKIAKAIKKEYPDKLIHTFAYQYSRKTPTNVVPLENVIVRLCNIECSWSKPIEMSAKNNPNGRDGLFYQDLVNWGKIANRLYIWDYAVNFRNYLLPFPNLKTMEENIKLYRKHHIKGVLMQGNFSYGGGGYLDELKSYLTARLLRDDANTIDEIINEFCNGYYGENAATDIIKYINLWEDAVKPYELWLYDDADHPMFTTDNIKKGEELLLSALSKTTNQEEYLRIEKLKLGIDYLKVVTLPMEYPNRIQLIDEFKELVKKHHITELFERTSLDLSIEMMKKSQYAKNRDGWYSLYYIMK